MDFSCKNFVFKNSSRPLTADIYYPFRRTRCLSPIWLYFHGGSWSHGSKDHVMLFPGVVEALRNDGVTVISCEYRLVGPEKDGVSMRSCIDDCVDAAKFFTLHAGAFGADPNCIFTGGVSAGGHLALMTAFSKGFGELPELKSVPVRMRGVLDFCGPSDLRPALSEVPNESVLAQYLGPDTPEALSPITYIRPTDRLRLPPCLAVRGELDTLVAPEQAEIIGEAYRAAGAGAFELITVPGVNHEFCSAGGGERSCPDTEKKILEFIYSNIL